MRRPFGWLIGRNNVDLTELTDVEDYLQSAFEPVTPRQEFVGSLRNQLLSQLDLFPGVPKNANPHIALLLLAGFFSGAILALIALRSFLTLMSMISLLRQYQRQAKQDSQT